MLSKNYKGKIEDRSKTEIGFQNTGDTTKITDVRTVLCYPKLGNVNKIKSSMCRIAKSTLVKNYDMDLNQTLTNKIICFDYTFSLDSEYILNS